MILEIFQFLEKLDSEEEVTYSSLQFALEIKIALLRKLVEQVQDLGEYHEYSKCCHVFEELIHKSKI